jgi:transcriptional regulator with XRE-family HTH domain
MELHEPVEDQPDRSPIDGADRREVQLGSVLAQLIERSGYSRNQRKVAAAVGVSPGALSQYIHEHARPSFRTLLALAEFFNVSLDYLVYGVSERQTVDYGPLARYIDHALATTQERVSRHSALVTQLGQMLSRQVETAARELLSKDSVPAGYLDDDDLLILESHSTATDLVTMDLQYDLIELDGAGDAAGRFLPVVAANVCTDRTYRIVVPRLPTADLVSLVSRFRRTLADLAGGDKVQQNCQFRSVSSPLTNGMVIYRLDVAGLAAAEPALHLRVSQYVDRENRLGYAIAPNGDSNGDLVMDARHLAIAGRAFEQIWAKGLAL